MSEHPAMRTEVLAILEAAERILDIPHGRGMPQSREKRIDECMSRQGALSKLLAKHRSLVFTENERTAVLKAISDAFPVVGVMNDLFVGMYPTYATFFIAQLGEIEGSAKIQKVWQAYASGELIVVALPYDEGEYVAYVKGCEDLYQDFMGVCLEEYEEE